MLRVLYLVSTLQRGGPTKQLLNLVSRLDRSRFAAKVLTLSPEPHDTLWDEFCRTGWEVSSLAQSRLHGLVLGRHALQKVFRQYKPQVVQTHGIRADSMLSASQRQFAHLSVARNFLQLDYPMTYGRIIGSLMATQHAKAMARADICVAVSESVASNLKDIFNLERIVTIRNGVDVDKYSPASLSVKRKIRRELGLSEDVVVWVASGHLSGLKRPLEMIEAFRRAAERSSIHLLLVGTGPLERECLTAAADLPGVTFLGRVPNVTKYLQASDCFVSASKAEGMPNAVLEALSCGLPVILSDIDPHAEVLSLEPAAGVLFPGGDLCRLAELFGNYRPTPTASALATQLAVRYFNTQRAAELYQEVYMEIADRAGLVSRSQRK